MTTNLVLPDWMTPEMLAHFKIDGPAKISFSGGRTSALMLYLVLMAHGGTLPDDVKVLFANTGKEREATLEFVRDCATHWGVNVVWVERAACECAIGLVRQRLMMFDEGKTDLRLMLDHAEGCPAQSDEWVGYREVDFETADRTGEPFAALIENRNYLPNPVLRRDQEGAMEPAGSGHAAPAGARGGELGGGADRQDRCRARRDPRDRTTGRWCAQEVSVNYYLIEIYTAALREHERRGDDEADARKQKLEVLWKKMTAGERVLAEKALFKLIA